MRLIDADALMKKLGITNMDCNECQWGTHYGNICCCCSRGGDFEDACIAIENAPTIEQPDIVRCKDCTYRGEINCPMYYKRAELTDDDFCSFGEVTE